MTKALKRTLMKALKGTYYLTEDKQHWEYLQEAKLHLNNCEKYGIKISLKTTITHYVNNKPISMCCATKQKNGKFKFTKLKKIEK